MGKGNMEHEELTGDIRALQAENKELKRRMGASEQNIRNVLLLADNLLIRIGRLERGDDIVTRFLALGTEDQHKLGVTLFAEIIETQKEMANDLD